MLFGQGTVVACAKIALIWAVILVLALGFTHVPVGLWTGRTSASSGMLPWQGLGIVDQARGVQQGLTSGGPLIFGVYDPADQFNDVDGIRIDHIFVQWNAFDSAVLKEAYKKAALKQRVLMVTVEPFTDAANWQDGGEELFSRIASGDYDGLIDGTCKALGEPNVPVLIRWGHEMDDESGRYPWARDDARGYIEAYRRFVSRCRVNVPAGSYIWSPKGLRNVESYYPGDQYVDFVGLSVYSLEAWDLDNLGRASVAWDAIGSRYNRVSGFNKPVIIAELGVSGDKDYVKRWLVELHKQMQMLPLLRAIVYFNDKDPYTWGSEYGSPDWRVTGDNLQTLMRGPDWPEVSAP